MLMPPGAGDNAAEIVEAALSADRANVERLRAEVHGHKSRRVVFRP